MKNAALILMAWLLSTFGNAQTIPFSIQRSAVFKDEYKQSVFVLAEKEAQGGMLFARYYESGGIASGDGLYIERYTPDLKLAKEFEFKTEHPNYEKHNMIVGVLSSAGIIHVVEIYYDLNEKSVICRANTISADFKVSKKELFRLTKDEIHNLGSFSLQDIYFDRSKEMWDNNNSEDIKSETDLSKSENTFPRINSNIFMVVNKSKTAFAIALDIKQNKSKELKLYAFDNNLQPKIDTHFTREAKDDKYIFENLQISEDGNSVYILGKSYDENLKKKKDGGKYYFELTKVTTASQKVLQIDPKEHFIGYLKPVLHDNDIVCLGFFSDLNDNDYTGICYFKTNSDLSQISNAKFNPFPKPFILDKNGESEKPKASTNLVFRNVFFKDNNDLIISAEEEDIWTSSSGVGIGVGTKTKLTYNYNDIVSAKLNASGELLWARNINKEQRRSDEANFFISYTSMVKNNDTYFFINASEKAKKLKDNRLEFGQVGIDKSNLNLLHINDNGDFDYQELQHGENSIPVMVSKGIVIENAVYFMSRKNKEKQLIKVTLD